MKALTALNKNNILALLVITLFTVTQTDAKQSANPLSILDDSLFKAEQRMLSKENNMMGVKTKINQNFK